MWKLHSEGNEPIGAVGYRLRSVKSVGWSLVPTGIQIVSPTCRKIKPRGWGPGRVRPVWLSGDLARVTAFAAVWEAHLARAEDIMARLLELHHRPKCQGSSWNLGLAVHLFPFSGPQSLTYKMRGHGMNDPKVSVGFNSISFLLREASRMRGVLAVFWGTCYPDCLVCKDQPIFVHFSDISVKSGPFKIFMWSSDI